MSKHAQLAADHGAQQTGVHGTWDGQSQAFKQSGMVACVLVHVGSALGVHIGFPVVVLVLFWTLSLNRIFVPSCFHWIS